MDPQLFLKEKRRLEASLRSLQADLPGAPWNDPCYAARFRADMGLFQDYGWITEAYELCEDLLSQASPEPDLANHETLLLAQAFVAHMDISRGRRQADHQVFFTKIAHHQDALLKGHACLGLGVLNIHKGRADLALEIFREGHGFFQQARHELYEIKMRVLEIMTLRVMEQHSEAYELTLDCLRDAKSLAPRTAAPLQLLLSVAAGHNTFIGKRFEAQRYSWQAVRLANSLPPSKAGGFAYFQHARGLHALSRVREAVIWCRKADPTLKVFDPFARISNLILLFQCLKEQRQWSEAEELLEQILDAPMVEGIWEDLSEILTDGIRFFLEIFSLEKARRMHAYLAESAARLARNKDQAKVLIDTLETQIHERKEALLAARRIGYGSRLVFIDRKERRLLLRHSGEIVQKNLARAPGSLVMLELLLESHQQREPIVSRQSFLERWAQRSQGKSVADPGKTLLRNLSALEEIGVVETVGRGKSKGLCFPNTITVHYIT